MATIIDLLDASATGQGTIRFLPDAQPVPIATIWAESFAAAAAVANRAGTGGSVGALLTNSRACVTGALGVWLSGNTLVSLPPPAPRQDPFTWLGHLKRMCELSGVEVVLVGTDHAATLTAAGVCAVAFEGLPGGAPGAQPPPGTGRLVQFTSGSTSNPKGVELEGTALAENVLAIRETIEMADDDLGATWLPLAHDMGLVGMLLTPLVAAAPRFGGRGLVIMEPQYFLSDPARWLTACAEFRATTTTVPNFAFDLATRTRSRHDGLDLSSVRTCITGAERIRADSLRRFSSAFRSAGFKELSLCPAYGMAENGLCVTMIPPSQPWWSSTFADAEVVSTGRPIPGVRVRVDPADVGEIQMASPSLLKRYVGAEVPWTTDGWFRTRDIGFMKDGELFVLGRADDTIDIGGRNIHPEDIENAADHPALRPNAVAAIPWGDRQVAVVAEVAHEDAPADLDAVARDIFRNVSRRTGVVVSALLFTGRGALVRTSSGKIKRQALRDLVVAGEVDFIGRFGKGA
jgi:acyl-CoA synthetase (AMP-forming)/AMP-acid ligase II